MGTHIQGLLFDKDGTLFDFQSTWGRWTSELIAELSNGDADLSACLAEVLGYSLETGQFLPDSMIIAGTPDEQIASMARHLPQWDAARLHDYIMTSTEDVPLVEVAPLDGLLSDMRNAGLVLGLSTNDGEKPARAHLDRAGITHHFDFIAGYDSGFGAKPAPGMQFGFCDHVELRPDQVVMIGDSTHDLQAGRAAGMGTIAVLTGLASRAELEEYADIILPDIGDIPAYLGLTAKP